MDKVYTVPFSDQNATKTLPFGAAHTYMAVGGPPEGLDQLYRGVAAVCYTE